MAITNFDELCKAVVLWSKRDDLLPLILQFIANCEQHMYDNETEALKLRSMEVVSTSTTTDKYITLPPNFESSRAVRITDDTGYELRYQTPEAMRRRPYPGRPLFFSIIGNVIEFDCVPDSNYAIEMQYFRKLTPLALPEDTNEILLQHSNIYLYGTLYESAVYEQDIEQQQIYERRFISAIRGANKTDKRGCYGNAPTMHIDNGMTP